MKNKLVLGFILTILLNTLSFGSQDDWSIRIGVKAERNRDTHNFLGVSKKASSSYDRKDLPEPPLPPISSGLCLYFPHFEWSPNWGKYATDIRPPILKTETYVFLVETGEYNNLTLIWSDIVNLPMVYRVTLLDEERNHSIDMRKHSEYTFDCSPGTKNLFKVVIDNESMHFNDETIKNGGTQGTGKI